jgi:CheY-like chemotaxis protein
MTSASEQPLILVAEDEDSVRQMVALALKALGYRTVVFPDGASAAEAIDAGAVPDAVLLDVRMPRMNGIDLVRHIRARAATVATPVVAMSAYSDELQAREMIEAGANAFLAKPFTIEELRATIAALTSPDA